MKEAESYYRHTGTSKFSIALPSVPASVDVLGQTYPPANAAFILFNKQITAHIAAQVLTHNEHGPLRPSHTNITIGLILTIPWYGPFPVSGTRYKIVGSLTWFSSDVYRLPLKHSCVQYVSLAEMGLRTPPGGGRQLRPRFFTQRVACDASLSGTNNDADTSTLGKYSPEDWC